jgi:apolipoprotein N-acyltransferase
LASTVADSSTDYIIAPETALSDGVWERTIFLQIKISKTIHAFLSAFPHAAFVTGASTYRAYLTKETATARKFKNQGWILRCYNTALQLSSNEQLEVYHKSKFVPEWNVCHTLLSSDSLKNIPLIWAALQEA